MNGLLPYEPNDKKISPWGGLRLIKELCDGVGLFDKLRDLPLQNPGSSIRVELYEIIKNFIMSVIPGAGNCNNASLISYDEVLKEISKSGRKVCLIKVPFKVFP